ncbi:MAG TPA: hypothetical protein PKO06_03195, partial [Candidatus Ozemobacteraceae bacterium]|nr:hypothetical protein [Candidatus Ozemobacteraceae bacterium]
MTKTSDQYLQTAAATARARLKLILRPQQASPAVVGDALSSRFKTDDPELTEFRRWFNALPVPIEAVLHLYDSHHDELYGPLGDLLLACTTKPSMTACFPYRLDLLKRWARAFATRHDIDASNMLTSMIAYKEHLLTIKSDAPSGHASELPGLACPLVKENQFVIWETAFTGADAAPWKTLGICRRVAGTAGARRRGVEEAIETAYHLLKKENKQDFDRECCLPAYHLCDVLIEGESCGLAIWAALWLRLHGRSTILPWGPTMLTGKLDEQGLVHSIGSLEQKVETALACGFKRVFVPAENLDALEDTHPFRRDARVLGVRSVDDVRQIILASDPIPQAEALIKACVDGVVDPSESKTRETMEVWWRKQLEEGSLMQSFALVRQNLREQRRRDKARCWRHMVRPLFGVFAAHLRQNQTEKIPRLLWSRLFQALVPDSVFLLHLPLLLDRYCLGSRAEAYRLYTELGLRPVRHDLDLALALAWGNELFQEDSVNVWRKPEFRSQFPLMCWYLFRDPLKAIESILSWPSRSPQEEQWRHSFFQQLKRLSPLLYACKTRRSDAKTATCLRADAPGGLAELRLMPAELVPIDRRPALMLKIRSAYGDELSKGEVDILRTHFLAHLESRFDKPTALRMTRLFWDDAHPQSVILPDEKHPGHQMIKRCLQEYRHSKDIRSKTTANASPASWMGRLSRAWNADTLMIKAQEAKTNDALVSTRDGIRELDKGLNQALWAMCRGKPVRGDDALAFGDFANPALLF